jgi:hypothetical protein
MPYIGPPSMTSRPKLDAVVDILALGGFVPETVIRIIRDPRKRSGVSQERMARALGISKLQLANAERQRFWPWPGAGGASSANCDRQIEGGLTDVPFLAGW